MSKKKRIGVLVAQFSSDSHSNIYGQSQSYMKFFQQYGTVLLITPDMLPEDIHIDLLVLPGGPDVSLALQEDVKQFPYATGRDQPTFTYFFKNNLQKWIDAGVPVFGICLGMQYLNVHFGGKLIHDGTGHQLRDYHWIVGFKDHEVGVDNTLDQVNSRHHQFVTEKNLSEALLPLAFSFEDDSIVTPTKEVTRAMKLKKLIEDYPTDNWSKWGISCVEAFRHKTKKIAGVQWHPEDIEDGNFSKGDYISDCLILWLLDPLAPAPASDETLVGRIDA